MRASLILMLCLGLAACDDGNAVGVDPNADTDPLPDPSDAADVADTLADAAPDRGPDAAPDAALDAEPDVGPPPCGPMLAFDPAGEHWLSRPWPSDGRRTADGAPDLAQTPLPDVGLIDPYRDLAAGLDGFGLNGAAYVRFDGPLDPDRLPTPAETLAADAPVQLRIVTGPRAGERVPLELAVPVATDDWVDPQTLVARPVPGAVLPEGQVVCALYTAALTGADGCPVRAAPGFVEARRTAPDLAPLADVDLDDLVGATCFSTHPATVPVRAVIDHARRLPPPAVRIVASKVRGGPARRIMMLEYSTPVYQSTDAPWVEPGSGDLSFDADGVPDPRMVTLEATLVVPDVEPPPGGFPVLQYAPGTGGTASICPAIARRHYASGHAVLCSDRPGMGPRGDGTEPPWPDFRNPAASVGMMGQEVVDHLVLTRVVDRIAAGEYAGQDIDAPALSAVSPALLGFSQGALMAGLAAGLLPELDAIIIDSGGGLAIDGAFSRPDSAGLVAAFAPVLGVSADNLTGLHPAVAVLQMLADPVDPINYAGDWLTPGMPDVLVLSGIRDGKTLAIHANALAAAAGVPPANPVLEAGPGHAVLGIEPVDLPVRGDDRRGTGVLVQVDTGHGTSSVTRGMVDHWLTTRLDGHAEARWVE